MLTLDPATVDRVVSGQVWAAPVAIAQAGAELVAEIDALASSLRLEHEGQPPGSIPGVAHARALYRAFGIDPTRLRPSSEALLRRVLDDRPFPKISNAVDLANFCALRFLLPIGLYDAQHVGRDVVLRPGLPGERYTGVRKDEVHLEGRPVLVDERGPFGNPTADSLRTAVTAETRALWMVVFAPATFDRAQFEAHLEFAAGAMARHLAPAGEQVAVGWTQTPSSEWPGRTGPP